MAGKLDEFVQDPEIHDELVSPANKCIVIMGGADTGKTTFVECLADVLAKNATVGIVDADMGQSHIGPPTTIAWGKIQERFSGWLNIVCEDFSFVGTVTPPGSLLPAVVGVKLMADRATLCCEKVIVDTTGLISEPAGRVLKQFKIDILSPDIILSLEYSGEMDHILNAFRGRQGTKIYRLPVPAQVVSKSTLRRSRYRFERMMSYFGGSHTVKVSMHDVGIRFTGEPQGPRMQGFENRIVSLRDVRDVALGIVEGVSHEKLLIIRTPLRDEERFSSILVGRTVIDTVAEELKDSGTPRRRVKRTS